MVSSGRREFRVGLVKDYAILMLTVRPFFGVEILSQCRTLSHVWNVQESSGYDGLDLRCFEVTNALHQNIKDNNTVSWPSN